MNAGWHRWLPAFLRDRIEGRFSLQNAIGNAGWLLADRAVRMVVGLVVSVWIARHLGPQQFGLWSYALALTTLLGGIASLGLDGIVVRELARRPGDAATILGTAFRLKLAGGTASLVIAMLTVWLARPGEPLVALLVGLSGATYVFQSANVVDLQFQATVQSRRTVIASAFAFFPMTVIRVVLLLADAPLEAFAWTALAESALTAASLAASYRLARLHIPAWRYDAAAARDLVTASWPLVFSSIAVMTQARIDQVMIGQMVGDAEVGQYAAALRVIEVFAVVPMVIASTLGPHVAQAKIANESLFQERMTEVYRAMFVVFLLTAAPLVLVGREVVVACFGQGYALAGSLIPLLAARLLFANFGVGKSLFVTNENLFGYALATAIAGAIVNILANLALIPHYGARGAVIAGLVSFAVTVFVADLFHAPARANLRMMLRAILSPHRIAARGAA